MFESSDTVVAPGEALLELADPAQLEVEADVLTADAGGLRVGTAVQVRSWGGEGALPAREWRQSDRPFRDTADRAAIGLSHRIMGQTFS